MLHGSGQVVAIHIGDAGAPLLSVAEAEARPGVGLVGDRYGVGAGTFSKKQGPDRELTLIEMEALEALERDYGVKLTAQASRRNLATMGVALNHLVGRVFQVGEITARGLRLCEPCGHLEKLTGEPRLIEGLRHRGGLRAQILSAGVIRVGDSITQAS